MPVRAQVVGGTPTSSGVATAAAGATRTTTGNGPATTTLRRKGEGALRAAGEAAGWFGERGSR